MKRANSTSSKPNKNGDGATDGPSDKRTRVESPRRVLADQTYSFEERIVEAVNELKKRAETVDTEVKDLFEGMNTSIRSQLKEAKRMPDNYSSNVRDLERQIRNLKEDNMTKSIYLKQSLTSRTNLKKQVDDLQVEKRALAEAANEAYAARDLAQASLAPTADRLQTLNMTLSRVHTTVLARVAALETHNAAYDRLPPQEPRSIKKLEDEYNALSRALLIGWSHVKDEYLRVTAGGTYPDVEVDVNASGHHRGSTDPDEPDPYTAALTADAGGSEEPYGSNGFEHGGEDDGIVEVEDERFLDAGDYDYDHDNDHDSNASDNDHDPDLDGSEDLFVPEASAPPAPALALPLPARRVHGADRRSTGFGDKKSTGFVRATVPELGRAQHDGNGGYGDGDDYDDEESRDGDGKDKKGGTPESAVLRRRSGLYGLPIAKGLKKGVPRA